MPRKNNPEETVERILSASMKIFYEKGFDKTSMQDIVDASDMSKGAIFYHFKSKEEVFEAAMEKRAAQMREILLGWLDEMKGQSAREKLISLIRRNIVSREMVSPEEVSAMVGLSPHLLMSNMRNNIAKSTPLLAGIIQEGIEDGSFTLVPFPDECAEVFMLLFNFWCDPHIFTCDMPAVKKRLLFLQHLMKQLGVDIVTDEIIDLLMDLLENFYREVRKHG